MAPYPCAGKMSVAEKYGRPRAQFRYPRRQWPNRELQTAPDMLSVDLRDGNQALPQPMNFEQKLRMFNMLVGIGFKQIEVGFPCANQSEYDFVRYLIDTPGQIPEDVTIQVLTPCREETIRIAVECLKGARRARLFTYLSSSDNYRETILGLSSEAEWFEQARRGTALARKLIDARSNLHTSQWTFGFGFEDFGDARPEVVARCAEVILGAWKPTTEEPMILGVSSSVEKTTPNVFADAVEYLSTHVPGRDTFHLSVHTHNDRGGAVATAELSCLAGAQCVEGCLFGNGERAGNMDLVTFALNLLTQGVDPGLDFSQLDDVRKCYEETTGLQVPPRLPYAGDYALKAFSGGHQDAISKGLRRRIAEVNSVQRSTPGACWKVPYLPIDPEDIGRSWDDVKGFSSQSGKMGLVWTIQTGLGLELPLELARLYAQEVKQRSGNIDQSQVTEEICASLLQDFAVAEATCATRKITANGHAEEEQALMGSQQAQLTDISSCQAIVSSLPGWKHFMFQHNLSSRDLKYAVIAKVDLGPGASSGWGIGLGADQKHAESSAVASALLSRDDCLPNIRCDSFMPTPEAPGSECSADS